MKHQVMRIASQILGVSLLVMLAAAFIVGQVNQPRIGTLVATQLVDWPESGIVLSRDKLKRLEAVQELVQLPLTIEVTQDSHIVRPASITQASD